jgi:hypothetical protein
MNPPGIFVGNLTADVEQQFESIDKATTEWTFKGARNECGWICCDCCICFPDGMPDSCAHGHQRCTDIIQRDKRNAMAALAKARGEG